MSKAPSVHADRLADLHKRRSERYAWARSVDPDALNAYEIRVAAERAKEHVGNTDEMCWCGSVHNPL